MCVYIYIYTLLSLVPSKKTNWPSQRTSHSHRTPRGICESKGKEFWNKKPMEVSHEAAAIYAVPRCKRAVGSSQDIEAANILSEGLKDMNSLPWSNCYFQQAEHFVSKIIPARDPKQCLKECSLNHYKKTMCRRNECRETTDHIVDMYVCVYVCVAKWRICICVDLLTSRSHEL